MNVKEKTIKIRNLEVETSIEESEFIHLMMSGCLTHENDYFFEIGKDKIVGKIKKHGNFKTQTSYEIGD